jgi:hypothetical protein
MRDFRNDQVAIWTSPTRLRRKDLRWALPFAAGTAALLLADTHIADSMPNTRKQIQTGEGLSKLGSRTLSLELLRAHISSDA